MGDTNGHLSNYEKWRIFTDGLTSPNTYIDFGFYYMIASCLQRRVWLPPTHMPVFPNMYVVFIGPPGVGKGLVITNVAKMLKHHKKEAPYSVPKPVTSVAVDPQMVETLAAIDYQRANETHATPMKHAPEKPLLFPIAADATTFEALVTAIARSLRHMSYAKPDASTGGVKQGIYTHSSICFALEELSSLFRKKAEDVVRFLQIAFDCGDYTKDTKTMGTDRVKNCCVSLLGAATQEFMVKLYKDDLANEGFASRTIFIYEPKDRKTAAFIPELNPLQRQCQADLHEHILQLSKLYGQVTMSSETMEFIEEWHRNSQLERPNISDSLKHYYARKKIHLFKLSMAVHFAESTEMSISLDEVKRALALLDGVERRMHFALMNAASSPYYRLSFKVVDFIRVNGPRTQREIYAAMYEHLGDNDPSKALTNILDYCLISGKLNTITDVAANRIRYVLVQETKSSESESF